MDAIGLDVAKGLQLTTGFYWDLNDTTRAWSKRFAATMGGRMPTEDHAGVYAATLAYLRAARDAKTVEGEQCGGAHAQGRPDREATLYRHRQHPRRRPGDPRHVPLPA